MVGAILLHNALFVRQSSGLVLADVLTFCFKVCEILAHDGRPYNELPIFLAKKKPIVKSRTATTDVLGMRWNLHSRHPSSMANPRTDQETTMIS